MKSIPTKVREIIKKTWLLLDYTTWLILDPSKFKRIDMSKIRKVLIIHLGAIGELIITTPVIKALKKNLQCEIDYMVKKGQEEVLKNNQNISKIITRKEEIKDSHPDLAVIISPQTTELARVCKKAGAKYIIGGFGGFKRGFGLFYTRRSFPINKKHTVEKNLGIIEKIGIKTTIPKLEFNYAKKEEENVKKFLSKSRIDKFAIIHPGFGGSNKNKHPSRLWPSEKYVEIANHLINKHKLKIILTGSKEEEEILEKISKGIKERSEVHIQTKLSLGELGALIKKAEIVIEPSTGVGHIASAFERPLITLMGRGDYQEWRPWNRNGRGIMNQKVCTSCNKDECRRRDTICMKSIETKGVKQKINELLK